MKPTDSELEILQILWTAGPSTVRFVHESLSNIKSVTYTTTLKTMQVMFDKGLLTRDTSQRSHVYVPAVTKSNIQSDILNRLKHSVFDGSTSELIMKAIGQDQPNKEELEKIRELIDKLDKDHD